MFWMTKHDNFSLIFHYQTVSEQKNIFPEVYFFFWNFKPQTVLSHLRISYQSLTECQALSNQNLTSNRYPLTTSTCSRSFWMPPCLVICNPIPVFRTQSVNAKVNLFFSWKIGMQTQLIWFLSQLVLLWKPFSCF